MPSKETGFSHRTSQVQSMSRVMIELNTFRPKAASIFALLCSSTHMLFSLSEKAAPAPTMISELQPSGKRKQVTPFMIFNGSCTQTIFSFVSLLRVCRKHTPKWTHHWLGNVNFVCSFFPAKIQKVLILTGGKYFRVKLTVLVIEE